MDNQRTEGTSGGIRFRKLRTATSVACAIAWVLLIALWVRSYWRFDLWAGSPSTNRMLTVGSSCGVLGVRVDNVDKLRTPVPAQLASGFHTLPAYGRDGNESKFAAVWNADLIAVRCPHGCLAFLLAAFLFAPWWTRGVLLSRSGNKSDPTH